jgi:hypothetical protein
MTTEQETISETADTEGVGLKRMRRALGMMTEITSDDTAWIVNTVAEHTGDHEQMELVRRMTIAMSDAVNGQSEKDGGKIAIVIHATLNLFANQCIYHNLPQGPLYAALYVLATCEHTYYKGDQPITAESESMPLSELLPEKP